MDITLLMLAINETSLYIQRALDNPEPFFIFYYFLSNKTAFTLNYKKICYNHEKKGGA
jgi:hypothetical protein